MCGYFFIKASTIGIEASSSSATENKISKFLYSCKKEASKFSYKLHSIPLSGLKIVTPGAESREARGEGICRPLYRVLLWS